MEAASLMRRERWPPNIAAAQWRAEGSPLAKNLANFAQ
jgi:hypothetical protein